VFLKEHYYLQAFVTAFFRFHQTFARVASYIFIHNLLNATQSDVNMFDSTWLHEQCLTAKRSYMCLAFIYYNSDGKACRQLHESCGFNSIHSLKLTVFIDAFCKKYLREGTDVLDPGLVVHDAFICNDVSASILEVLEDCDRNGWTLVASSW
jgi:hypothetical protein